MGNEKLISFDIKANFAFFKKPDYNAGIQMSYNMLHKPAFLGILGAIIGLDGFKSKGVLPEYFNRLKHLQVGIMPLQHYDGSYQKTVIRYTNGVGYANKDGNLLIDETMLIAPAYRCFILLDTSRELEVKIYDYIMNQKAEFIPYLGKNEYQAWIEEPIEYEFKLFNNHESFSIDSLFIKYGVVSNKIVESDISIDYKSPGGTFTYFERLPVGYNKTLMQYEMANFAFTNWKMKHDTYIPNTYTVYNKRNYRLNIQLF